MSQVNEPRTSSLNRLAYLFYIVLTAAQVAVGGFFLYIQADHHHGWTDRELWLYLWTQLSYIAITATAVSVCITEMGGYAMVLASQKWAELKTKWAERDERMRQEGQAERDAEWTSWLERWRNAQEEGREFTEPPPSEIKKG